MVSCLFLWAYDAPRQWHEPAPVCLRPGIALWWWGSGVSVHDARGVRVVERVVRVVSEPQTQGVPVFVGDDQACGAEQGLAHVWVGQCDVCPQPFQVATIEADMARG